MRYCLSKLIRSTPLRTLKRVVASQIRWGDLSLLDAIQQFPDMSEYFWDAIQNIHTRYVRSIEKNTGRHHDSIMHVPTPPWVAAHLLKIVQLSRQDIFVDIGSGMGQMPLLAATQNISGSIGFELQEKFHLRALNNLSKATLIKSPVSLLNQDICNFDFKTGTVFYLFDPFGEKTMMDFLKNLTQGVKLNPRSIKIVYLSPQEEYLFERFNWLKNIANITLRAFNRASIWQGDLALLPY